MPPPKPASPSAPSGTHSSAPNSTHASTNSTPPPTAVEHVALKCWQEKLNDFPLDTLTDAARALGRTGFEPEIAAQQIGARSLFVREAETFRFLDSSIFEWLVARIAAAGSRWELLAMREISELMARFLVDLDVDLDPDRAVLAWADSILSDSAADSTAKKNALLVRREGPPARPAGKARRQGRSSSRLKGSTFAARTTQAPTCPAPSSAAQTWKASWPGAPISPEPTCATPGSRKPTSPAPSSPTRTYPARTSRSPGSIAQTSRASAAARKPAS